MISDPIADMLTRIKNAYLSRYQTVVIPYSKIKEVIAKILVKEGYLKKSKVKSQKSKVKQIICELKYEKEKPAFEDFVRVSKPGRRIYARWDRLPRTLSGFGITLVSTPRGMMTDRQARKEKLGGEIICQVY